MVCDEAEVQELLEPEFKDSAAVSIAGFLFFQGYSGRVCIS